MTHETYYEYDSNINLNNQDLYEYIKYNDKTNTNLDTKSTQSVQSKKTKLNKKDNDNDTLDTFDVFNIYNKNTIGYTLLCCLIILFFYFVFTGKLQCGEKMSPTINSSNVLSDDYGMGSMRAVFSR